MKTISQFILIFIVFLLLNCQQFDKKEKKQKKPNIILIMADDMGYSDLGCYGSEINTPNLDKLAENGLKYTQMYNATRCCPSRASLLTGLYPHQAGLGLMVIPQDFPGYPGDLSPNSVTLAEVLKKSGYSTYAAGKWHVVRKIGPERIVDTAKHNWPLQRGFDKFYGTPGGGGSYFYPADLTYGNDPVHISQPGYYYTDAISDSTSAFIESHLKTNKNPFFCYVAYTAPHYPLHAFDEDIQKYKGVYDKGWDTIRQKRYERMIDLGIIEESNALSDRHEWILPWKDADHKQWRIRSMEVYAAMIDRMDRGIGKIIKTLEENGELENTLIVFLSDNGAEASGIAPGHRSSSIPDTTFEGNKVMSGNYKNIMPGPDSTFQSYGIGWANVSNTPFRWFKQNTYEGGISTPLIVHWPKGIKGNGELRKQTAHIIDFMPTFMEVASADYITLRGDNKTIPFEGKSLVPSFENKPIDREYLAWEHLSNRGILKGQWKLVSYRKKWKRYWENGHMKFESKSPCPDWELYNFDNDRTETNNLADKYPDIVREMSDLWEEWAVRVKVKPWPYQ